MSSDGNVPFKKGNNKRRMYQKNVVNATISDSIGFLQLQFCP